MTVEVTTPETKSANELAEDRTNLAVQRTLMAADRSLMAWIRTALSMISFGFTIYKVLQGLQEKGGVIAKTFHPEIAGLFLIGLGTLAIVMGTIEYWSTLRELYEIAHKRMWRPSFIIALIIAIGGLFLFFGIITRLL